MAVSFLSRCPYPDTHGVQGWASRACWQIETTDSITCQSRFDVVRMRYIGLIREKKTIEVYNTLI